MNQGYRLLLFISLIFASACAIAQPANDVCEGATPFPVFPAPSVLSCPIFDGTTYNETITGTTVGATPSLPFTQCQDANGNATVDLAGDVWFTFIAAGSINDITITSGFDAGVQLSIFTGEGCDNIQLRRCAATEAANLETRLFANPGDTVFILVAGNTTDGTNEADFSIDIESSAQCELCLQPDDGIIDLNPRSPSGRYACGSTVNVCFTLNRFRGNQGGSVEWLHSMIPDFGPGWDTSSVVPTVFPPTCGNRGSWRYYPDGWTGCQTDSIFPLGFAFEIGAGDGDPCASSPADPGDNYGDGGGNAWPGGGTCTDRFGPTTWCWDINVRDCPPGDNTTFDGEDLGITVQVFSDAVSGSWTNRVCNENPIFESIGNVIICDDDDPLADPTPEFCADANDGMAEIRPNGGMGGTTPFNITIRDIDGNSVYTCDACVGPQTATGLPDGDYVVEVVNTTTACPRNAEFTIEPGTRPIGEAEATPTCPSEGAIPLVGTVDATMGEIYYVWTGPNGFRDSTMDATTFTNDPADEGMYTLQIYVDGCESEPIDPIEVNYLEEPELFINDIFTTVCAGEQVRIGVTGGMGPYTYQWQENGVNIPFAVGPNLIYETTDLSIGVTTYTVIVMGGTCPGPLSTEVNVLGPPETLIEYSPAPGPDFCLAEEITLTSLQTDGTPWPAGTLFDWDAGASTTASYTFDDTDTPGDFTVDLMITDTAGCTNTIEVPYTINEGTVASVIPEDMLICRDGSVELCPDIASGSGPFTFVWNTTPAQTTECITVDINTAPLTGITVAITDANGCEITTDPVQVRLAPELTPVVFDGCDMSDVSTITFTWSDVGQTRNEVYADINNAGEVLLDANVTGLSFTVAPVMPGDTVTFRVVPFFEGEGLICEGPSNSQTCIVLNCFSPSWQFTPMDAVCLVDDPQEVDFTITAVQEGDIFLTSTDLGIMDMPADPTNTTTLQLPQLPAGTNTGVYEITAAHESFDGVCTFDTTVTINVIGTPTQDFDITETEICEGGNTTFEYTADATGLSLEWQFPAGTTVLSGDVNTVGPINVQFNNAGTQTVSLVLGTPDCGDVVAMRDVEVIAPLLPPVISCGPAGVLSVNFVWDDQPGVDEYEITIDGGPPFRQTETSFGLSGLMENQEVVITVTAIGSGICGNSMTTAPFSCFAALCPTFGANLNGLETSICLENGDETIDLSGITIEGGSGNMAMLSFSGPGVTGTTFDAAAAGGNEVGITHDITIEYVEEGPCTFTTNLPITVFERPTAFIIAPTPVCVGDEVDIQVGSTNFVSNDNIMVDFGGAIEIDDADPDDNSYRVFFPDGGDFTITASVISNISGCPSEPATSVITVNERLPAPTVICADQQLTEVTFTWDAVPGATGYIIVSNVDGFSTVAPGVLSVVVDDLLPGQVVDVTVTAIDDGPCPNSPDGMATCSALPCPPGVAEVLTADMEFCNDGMNNVVTLEGGLTEGMPAGTFAWSGPGLVVNGTDTEFQTMGLPIGTYTVFLDYDGPSICDSRDSVVFSIVDPPVAAITADATQVCAGATLNVNFDGTPDPSVVYIWDWDGGVPTVVGDQQFTVTWNTPGPKTIMLMAGSGCNSTASIVVDVSPTLDGPAPTCVRQDLDAVLFEWPDVAGATEGYQVSVNGGPFGPVQVGTSFLVDGLARGGSVTISVRSVRSGTTCDLSPAVEATCTARECPPVTFAPAAAQTEFCGDDINLVDLEANLSGDDGTGATSWSGTGVVDNGDGTFSFDPQLAGVGEHTLTVMYTQEVLCTYDDQLVITVFAEPSAEFTVSETVFCTGSDVIVSLDQAPGAATVTPDFDGGTAVDNGNGSFNLSYPMPGMYTITLLLESNGCTAEASQVVTVQDEVSAGTERDGLLELCVTDAAPVELSLRLENADAGGTWATISGNVPAANLNTITGTLNRAGLTAGNYTFSYTVGGNSCPEDVAEVSLSLLAAPLTEAGPDQVLTCQMGMVTLGSNATEMGDGFSYQWTSNNPDAMILDPGQPIIDVGQTGTYFLQVTNQAGCINTDSVVVTAEIEAPVMQVRISPISCFSADDGAIFVTGVDGGQPPYTFEVNGEDQGTNTLFNGLLPQEYDIRVTDANGCFSNIILDLEEPDELTIQLRFPGDSAETNFGEEIFITANVNGGNAIDTLIWQPDSLKNTPDGVNGIQFIATETRMISVTVVDDLGCTATDNQLLIVRKNRPVYFPTAFSPNGDNNNDVFFIGGDIDLIESVQDFRIYDRWGELMYDSNATTVVGGATGDGVIRFLPNNPAFGWDGMHNGSFMNPQVFVYTAKVNFVDGESIVYKGDFVLMR